MPSLSLTRTVQVLALLALSLLLLYVGRLFLVPLVFAAILAMLLAPVARQLERWGAGRIVSGLLCVLLLLAFMGGICWAIGAQAANISEQLPQIQQKVQVLLQQAQHWIQQRFGVAPREQIQFVEEQVAKFGQSANRYLTTSLKGVAGLLGGLVLVLLYLFFMLWGRHKFREFFLRLAPSEQHQEVNQMLQEIMRVGGQYLSGRLLSVLFLTVVYGVGFLVIGLKNALLLALIAALPTLVPYVGAYVGAIFPLIMAMVGGSAGQLLPTLGVILFAQAVDNNVVEPLVMGSRLNLSPIFTIIAVVLGELLWGIPGMILFEPLTAILRIVCSHVPALHPYAFLLADEAHTPQWIKRVKSKSKQLL
ncbi:AI-2E family transporter [Hymenobacter taeanensis]|uniref:AI-2E family transporter n=1 Tax=Hymenobacter taeanensis TaxID=2735321 RepID=A0A6M6BBW0_9BACT|nr:MULTISPECIES: AI-2E family transporter [Hymenobacter]QJX45462.1 AI-2E family transporter [Hymenobacter taeanensis]UOQ81292.1 AI-2E family transporter [Hymenobacter sp. 5414T-23]